MVNRQRRHATAYKIRIALEKLKGSKTISQLSNEHEIHANMKRSWKRPRLEDGPIVCHNHEKSHQSLNYLTPAEEHFVLCSEPAAFA